MECEKTTLLIAGKTKEIWNTEESDLVYVVNKDDITKNDDASQTQIMKGKADSATTTTCEIFKLLHDAGIPTSFVSQTTPTSFYAKKCQMIPLEVIARRSAVGSYLKRNPHLKKAGKTPHRFHSLEFEMFLKTKDGKLTSESGSDIISNICDSNGKTVDDPLIINPRGEGGAWGLAHPKKPEWTEETNLTCNKEFPRVEYKEILPKGYESLNAFVDRIEELTRKTFLVLEGAWAQLGCRLIDFKIEFGINSSGDIVISDVIDNDSWRLKDKDWNELSKENFRQGETLFRVQEDYQLVAELSKHLHIPKQTVITWRGSPDDNIVGYEAPFNINHRVVTISGHKSPRKVINRLEEILAEYPEGGVIIAFVGMSNGLGTTLSSRTSWPVISVPNTKEPNDVWSSLRCPSKVPNATILNYKNALLQAYNILAQKNPVAYMFRQYEIEKLDDNQ